MSRKYWYKICVIMSSVRFTAASPHWFVKNHSHSSYELHFIPHGKGRLTANRKNYDITPGTFYLTGPGVYHEQKTDVSLPMAEYCINFDFKLLRSSGKSDNIPEIEVNELVEILKGTNFWFGKDEFGSVDLFEKVYHELSHPRIGYFTSVRNYICQIIINSLRSYVDSIPAYSFPYKSPEDYRRQIVDEMFHNRYRDISMEKMAKAINVSKRHLERIVNQYYSMSFNETAQREGGLDINLLANEPGIEISGIWNFNGWVERWGKHRWLRCDPKLCALATIMGKPSEGVMLESLED